MILVDGKRCATVSALDRGFNYGDGVFRTMRAGARRVLCWPRHYAKLAGDCGSIGIECPTEDLLLHDIDRVLRNQAPGVVKIVVSRGQGGRGYGPSEVSTPLRVVARFQLPPPRNDCDDEGVQARWCATRLGFQPALAGVKHLNRLDNVLARREWSEPQIAEGLMLDHAGQVIEGTMSNLFILEADRLVTPRLDGCGVAGVQRDRLIALAGRLGIPCAIDALTPERVIDADQVYLLNSVIGLWWVSRLEARTWKRHQETAGLIRALAESDD